MHNSARTVHTQRRGSTRRTPGHRDGPRTFQQAAHVCAQPSPTDTQTHTQRNPKKQAARGSQPRARTHFQDTKNTDNPRKGPPACTSRPGHTPSPSSDPPTGGPPHTAAARRRDRVCGTGATSHSFGPPARGSGEDTPAPGSAPPRWTDCLTHRQPLGCLPDRINRLTPSCRCAPLLGWALWREPRSRAPSPPGAGLCVGGKGPLPPRVTAPHWSGPRRRGAVLTTAAGGERGAGRGGTGRGTGAGAEPGAKQGERCRARNRAPSTGWKLWRPARGRSALSAPGSDPRGAMAPPRPGAPSGPRALRLSRS